MPTRETSQRLDDESWVALGVLAKSELQDVMSDGCCAKVGCAILEVLSVSIQIDKRRFVVIESDWADTSKEALDYHCLTIRVSDRPRGIFYDPDPPKGGANYKWDHAMLSLGARSGVARIEILEDAECGESESVVYDAGLLITRLDGVRLAIVRTESIVGSLQIAHTPDDIEHLVGELRVRPWHAA